MEAGTGKHGGVAASFGSGAEPRVSTWRSRPARESEAPAPGSRFADVWRVVAADAYDALPDRRVRLTSLSSRFVEQLYAAARRTLARPDDLLPPFDKLVHPTGICLRGVWRITEQTPYTGLFRAGTEALIIARASDALGEYRPGRLRLLGLAGKLYPTSDPDHAEPLATANFFTLENLGGTRTAHFVDAALTSDLWPFSLRAGILAKLPLGTLAGAAFALADRAWNAMQPLIRQLYPIAELGEAAPERARAPAVMRLVGSPRNRRVESADLREELQIGYHPGGIRFELQVADHRSLLVRHGFRPIGEVLFTDSIASYSGDHRLHFRHAPYRRPRSLRGWLRGVRPRAERAPSETSTTGGACPGDPVEIKAP